jgi:uncharacterized protein (DUF427 family)
MRPIPLPVGPGQESVWDYPRPPRLERTAKPIEAFFAGERIVSTTGAYRVLETSHPPVYYFPPEDVRMDLLRPVSDGSFCEWKGTAEYLDLVAGNRVAERIAWRYPRPSDAFAAIAGYVAFYAEPLDRATIGGEIVIPQPGGFYGGWITPEIVGPFKGGPGSRGW